MRAIAASKARLIKIAEVESIAKSLLIDDHAKTPCFICK
uniref:UDP-N-acetylglucosamine transferase subunit ALG14 n=1 Tax=Rhizophora mucronata TaxID=61149 RepID=A0A2P2JBA0_RHIMU